MAVSLPAFSLRPSYSDTYYPPMLLVHSNIGIRRRRSTAVQLQCLGFHGSFDVEQHSHNSRKHWDEFYERHQNKFFKDRHYLEKDWGQYFCDDNNSIPSDGKIMLEAGCGAGNTIFPLAMKYPRLFLHACDFSHHAITLVKSHTKFHEDQMNVFVCNIAEDNLCDHIMPSSVDIVTLISPFQVLSHGIHSFPQKIILRRSLHSRSNLLDSICSLRSGMADQSRNRKYRNWTITEDAKLVEALVNMVNTGGFKADNGFKSGYLQYLEQVMKDSVPDSGILGKPHIESRIKTMKKDWQVVHDMVNGTNTSGFGYDSEKQCVTAEAPVWESYLQAHKEASKWKNKTFPHFEDLSIIFGKDRAQGSRVRDVVEMEEQANIEEQEQPSEDTESSHNVHNVIDMRSEGSSRGSKKRKTRVETLVDGMHSAALLLGEKFENASKSMVDKEMDIQNKTSMVNSELVKMQSLSRVERFKAIKKITSEPDNVLIFWSLEEREREEWVRFMLES